MRPSHLLLPAAMLLASIACTADEVQSTRKPRPWDVDAPQKASLEKAVASTRSAVSRCANSAIGTTKPESVAQSGASFGPDAVDSACAPAAALYETWVETLARKTRSSEWLLSHQARVADDIDVLKWALDAPNYDVLVDALAHIHGSLEATLKVCDKITDGIDQDRSFHARYRTDEPASDSWQRSILSDKSTIVPLKDHLHRLAFIQGDIAVLVRNRMLDSFPRRADVELDERRVALESSDLDPKEIAARLVYLDAAAGYVDAASEIAARYREPTPIDEAARAEMIAKVEAASDAFDAAWTAERARLEGADEPSPFEKKKPKEPAGDGEAPGAEEPEGEPGDAPPSPSGEAVPKSPPTDAGSPEAAGSEDAPSEP